MVQACRLLGAQLTPTAQGWIVEGVAGKIRGAEDVIQAGNSGLILRLVGAIAGLSPKPIVITGDHSIRHLRPVAPLLEGLAQLGAKAFSLRGQGAPIFVQGPIYPGSAVLCGKDSQPISGLLIASAFSCGPIELFVTNPGETPWVNLTLDWFKRLSIPCETRAFDYYRVPGGTVIEGFSYKVAADFSSLAFPLTAALVTGSELIVDNLDFSDPQGDKAIISLLQKMRAPFEIDEGAHTLFVRKTKGGLQGGSFDLNDCIDATPILAVIGCFAEGKTEIRGIAIARNKESDRVRAIAMELKKMGAKIEEHPDGLTISRSDLNGAHLSSHNDHRIALALAVAALAAKGTSVIDNVDCTQKSFPQFCATMQKLGASIIYLR